MCLFGFIPEQYEHRSKASKGFVPLGAFFIYGIIKIIGDQMPAGRPVEWNEKAISKLEKELDAYIKEVGEREPIASFSPQGRLLSFTPPNFPSMAEFILKSGNSNYIYDLAELWPGISERIKKVKALQEHFLMTYALPGHYNPAFAIFTAKNILGWRDSREEIKKDESPARLPFNLIVENDTETEASRGF